MKHRTVRVLRLSGTMTSTTNNVYYFWEPKAALSEIKSESVVSIERHMREYWSRRWS